jgi:hypothetical protein
MGNVELVNTPAYPHRTNILPHYDLFSPRLGLAYQAIPSLVIHTGFAILYPATANLQQSSQPYNSAINTAITILNANSGAGSLPVNSFSNPFPGGVLEPSGRSSNYQSVIEGQSILINQPHEPATYVEQWNLDIQQDLGHQTLMEIAYVGDHGLHQQLAATSYAAALDQIPDQYLSMGQALLDPVPNPFHGLITTGNLAGATIPAGQLLRPYPQYYNVLNAADVAGMSNYNALQAKLESASPGGAPCWPLTPGAGTWALRKPSTARLKRTRPALSRTGITFALSIPSLATTSHSILSPVTSWTCPSARASVIWRARVESWIRSFPAGASTESPPTPWAFR